MWVAAGSEGKRRQGGYLLGPGPVVVFTVGNFFLALNQFYCNFAQTFQGKYFNNRKSKSVTLFKKKTLVLSHINNNFAKSMYIIWVFSWFVFCSLYKATLYNDSGGLTN